MKLMKEKTGSTFNPNPSDKYLSAIGTIKKLEAYEITVIINTVRVPASLYSNNLASLHINSDNLGTNKPWNNSSDRVQAHGPNSNSASSSTKQNYGVDIKHNSYDRYLGRKKSQNLKTERRTTPDSYTTWPTYWGNKTYKFSIVNCQKTC